MDPYVCQLCSTVVYVGEKHPCFSNTDYETNYVIPHRSNLPFWDSEGHAANSNDNYGNMCQASNNTSYTWQASTSRVNSVLSVGNDSPVERSLEVERDFTRLPIQPDSPFHAPLGRRMDFGVNQPLHSKGDIETQPGLSTINPHSIGPDGKKKYVCHLCSRQFRDKWRLLRHGVTHTGERPFICVTCGRGFTQKASLNTHARMHTGEKLYECKFCGKPFAHKGAFETHVRTHTGEKPFSCDICGRSFSDRSARRRHVQTHYGIKRFKCGECEETFSSNEHRSRHAREKHPHEVSHHMS